MIEGLTADEQYAGLIRKILNQGSDVHTRNSDVKRLFAQQVVFHSTPLVTLRKTPWKTALREWEWFMSGSCDINKLHPSAQHWWKPWADGRGRIPNNYSQQFRYAIGGVPGVDGDHYYWDTNGYDQINGLIKGVKDHPFSRRNILTTWNAAEMAHKSTPITNCHHSLTQLFVEPEDNRLHMVTYQRSSDVIVGLPANWIQTWAFLLWLAHRSDRKVGSLTWIGGDCHIYREHLDLARRIEQLSYSGGSIQQPPQLIYRPTSENFLAEDFSLDRSYEPQILETAKMVV